MLSSVLLREITDFRDYVGCAGEIANEQIYSPKNTAKVPGEEGAKTLNSVEKEQNLENLEKG